MSRKKKHGAKKPPLSALDKTIYDLMIIIGVILAFLLTFTFGKWIPSAIALSEVSALACGEQWGLFASFPIFMWISGAFIGIASYGLEQKQPIFGNKDMKAYVFQPVLKVYPLVSKEFWQKLSAKAKRKLLILGITLAVLFVVSVVILLLGIYPRVILFEDMHMERYGITNQMTDVRHLDTADSVTIEIDSHGGGKTPIRYNLYLRIFWGKESYDFEISEFLEMSDAEALHCIISIKEQFGSRVNFVRKDMADRLIRDQSWGSEEKALLYELFELK